MAELSLASLGALNPILAGRQPGSQYNTPLSLLGEFSYRQWVKDNRIPTNPDATAPQDYDMRGFYRALQQGDPRATTAINSNDGRIHFPDYWKTPLHQSFSNESQWAPANAPSWNDVDQLVTPGGRIVFDERRPKTLADLVGMK